VFNIKDNISTLVFSGIAVLALLASGIAQSSQAHVAKRRALGLYTFVTVADGLDRPWSLAFLPDGTMLVTELPGRLRIIRDGVLDPQPVPGLPAIWHEPFAGLMDVVIDPDFTNHPFVYLSYNKQGPPVPRHRPLMAEKLIVPDFYHWKSAGDPRITTTLAVARGRWDGTTLTDIHEIFVADDWKDQTIPASSAGRMTFGHDGMLYVAVGAPNAPASQGPWSRVIGGVAQDPTRDGGKVLRLRKDGAVPSDNPFIGKPGFKPEIYTLGHRNVLGLALNPQTGVLWEHENGPAEGDELNILKPGANYGWPTVGMGRDYRGDFIGGVGHVGPEAGRTDAYKMYLEGMEQPFIAWMPATAPSGMLFYRGERYPNFKGSLFVGHLKGRRVERIVMNEKGYVTQREDLFVELNQRIRDVRQSPDGWIYLLTDSTKAEVLKVEL
jgi:glucose/arabinose dehydrogenase